MLTSLETQKNEQLAQVNKWFEHAHLVLNQSHAFSTGEIKVKCTEVHALLAQHLETTRQTQLNIADCHVFTWDPSCRGSSVRLTNENKTASCSVDQTVFGTTLLPSSPVEWEVDLWNSRGIAPTNCYIGVGKKNEVNLATNGGVGKTWSWRHNGELWFNGGKVKDVVAQYTSRDVIKVRAHLSTRSLTFYKNGTLVATSRSVFPTIQGRAGTPLHLDILVQ